jgi:hypothetical protein
MDPDIDPDVAAPGVGCVVVAPGGLTVDPAGLLYCANAAGANINADAAAPTAKGFKITFSSPDLYRRSRRHLAPAKPTRRPGDLFPAHSQKAPPRGSPMAPVLRAERAGVRRSGGRFT